MEFAFVGVITILFVVLSIIQRNQERIESKLNIILEQLGVTEPYAKKINDELKAELIKLIEEDKKIKAIKKLREATGMGLKEAKDYVDSLL